MVVYYCLTIVANIAALIVFYKNINITALSIMPIIFIVLAVFQASYFKNEKVENGFRTAYGSHLNAEEENKMFGSTSVFLFATIPWMIPFVFFFPSFVKAISIFVYIIGLVGGPVTYRIKNNLLSYQIQNSCF